MCPAGGSTLVYLLTLVALLCLVTGKEMGLRVSSKPFLMRYIPDGINNIFFFQVPTLDVTVLLLSEFLSLVTPPTLSLLDLSCAGV